MKIKRNACLTDQILRGGLGITCSYFGFIDTVYINSYLIATLVGLFGLLNLFTAFTAHCPIYKLAGIDTIAHEDDA